MRISNIFLLFIAIYTFVFSPFLQTPAYANPGSEQFLQAQKSLKNKNFIQAQELLKEALRVSGEKDQELAEIHKFLGYVYLGQDQWQKGYNELMTALQYNPDVKLDLQFTTQLVLDAYNRAKQDLGIPLEDNMAPVISHIPVVDGRAGNKVTIQAVITDNKEVVSATLLYKQELARDYKAVSMEKEGDNKYRAEIPGDVITENGINYYIAAVDASSNTATKGTPYVPLQVSTTGKPVKTTALAKEEKEEGAGTPFYKKVLYGALAIGVIGAIAGGGGGGGGGGDDAPASSTGSVSVNW